MKHTYIVAAAVGIMALQTFAMEEKLESSHWNDETGEFIKTVDVFPDYWDSFHDCDPQARKELLKSMNESAEQEARCFAEIVTAADLGDINDAITKLESYPKKYKEEHSYLSLYIGKAQVQRLQQHPVSSAEILLKTNKFFLQSIDSKPNAQSYIMLANLYKKKSDHRKELEYLEAAHRLSPAIVSDAFLSDLRKQYGEHNSGKENGDMQLESCATKEVSGVATSELLVDWEKELRPVGKWSRGKTLGVCSKKICKRNFAKTKALRNKMQRSKMRNWHKVEPEARECESE